MASSKAELCGPCGQGIEKPKAVIWCYNCDEGLCLICSSHHKKNESTCNHKTIDIQTYKPPIFSIKTREQFNIDKMTRKIDAKIEMNIGVTMSHMICLMDGRVVIVEWNDKIILFTPDSKLKKTFSLPRGAFSVTQINWDTIAVTYPVEKAIKIYNMEKEIITKVITLDKICWGLSFSNNCLAVGLKGGEIRVIDLEGNTLKSIQIQSKSHLQNLVYCNERIIYSDYDGKTVHCLGGSGKQIWENKQDLAGPWGLCSDKYGSIIIADWKSNRIVVISNDGKDSKVLINKEDGLGHTNCICLKQDESYGFMCDTLGNFLQKYNLSYE